MLNVSLRQKILMALIAIGFFLSLTAETHGFRITTSVVTFALALVLFWVHRREEEGEGE
ncbi:hypothetical protein [Roseobacter sp. HKCCA0434]|uniref:hypothetical protein n=1 Tax=Roseobacter sp. HKCCA0434 TaxID=3079297 RepID=UPI002905AF47|nr:hypothetical protein [Roseobacter sp. HKCCA0434]